MRHSRRRLLAGLVAGLALTASRLAAQAAAVLVRDGAAGRPVAGAGALAATLWDQIRQALTATSLSDQSGLTLYRRTIDRSLSVSDAILEAQVSYPRPTGSRPFVPLLPAQLAELEPAGSEATLSPASRNRPTISPAGSMLVIPDTLRPACQ